VNCYQELCIELWSVINFHREIEPANLLQYDYGVLSTSETSVYSYVTTQRRMPEGCHLYTRRREKSFREQDRETVKCEINELDINSKSKNMRDKYTYVQLFKKGCQPMNN
jgi:hypothetical protein